MAALGVWPVPWATNGRRGGVAGSLGPYAGRDGVLGPLVPVWPPWGCGRSPGPRMAAVGAWPVPWAPYGRRGGVAGPLSNEWPSWMRGRSPGPRISAVGAWPVPGPRMAAVGAWPVP